MVGRDEMRLWPSMPFTSPEISLLLCGARNEHVTTFKGFPGDSLRDRERE